MSQSCWHRGASQRELRKATAEEARRTDREVICTLLRHGWNEASPSSRPRKCFQAAVDSCWCVQSEPDFPNNFGCGNAKATPKPPTKVCFRCPVALKA